MALCVALSRIQLRSQLEVQRANAQRGPTSALRRLRVLFASVAVLRTGQQTRAGRGPMEAVWSWARARGIVGSGAFRRVLSVSLSLSLGLSVGGVREARLACVPAYSCTTGTVLTTGAVWRALLVSSRPVHEGGSYARPDSQ